jgi:hypothetical protein
VPTAYINALYRSLGDGAAADQQQPAPTLRERFSAWFGSVPEVSRLRAYSMVELERALGTQGKYLSPVLLDLGWQRRRKWSSRQQYLRYWVPPGM